MGAKVVLSVDPNYVLAEGDHDRDVWIVTSEANLALADTLRRSSGAKSTTIFNDLGSRVENALSMLPTVFEHHPQAVGVIVRGLSDQERNRLKEEAALKCLGTASDGEVEFGRRK